MDMINEYIEPGTYEDHNGNVYVVVNVITHNQNTATGEMEKLQDTVVVYRDLIPVLELVNGKKLLCLKFYSMPVSIFFATVTSDNGPTKRFKKI